jgi:hypothetical protein
MIYVGLKVKISSMNHLETSFVTRAAKGVYPSLKGFFTQQSRANRGR